MNKKIENSLEQFLSAFQQVFDKDWEYTKIQLGIRDEWFISPEGTFLNPKVENETEDWGHRAALLDEYKRLRALLENEKA